MIEGRFYYTSSGKTEVMNSEMSTVMPAVMRKAMWIKTKAVLITLDVSLERKKMSLLISSQSTISMQSLLPSNRLVNNLKIP